MAVSIKRRIPALMAVAAAAIALTLPASPASAQAGGPGAQATPVVGVSGTANCPTPVAATQVVYAGPAGGTFFIVQSRGACTSFSADAEGAYTVGGSAPLSFTSSCQTSGLQHGGGVEVPAGTVVNPGTAGEFTTGAPQTITTPNTVVRFPNGTVATLNVVNLTATTVTRTAIVSGGTAIGRVICGQANVYPLAVETAAAAPELPAPVSSSGDGGGVPIPTVVAAVVALALAAQLAVGMRRRKSNATA